MKIRVKKPTKRIVQQKPQVAKKLVIRPRGSGKVGARQGGQVPATTVEPKVRPLAPTEAWDLVNDFLTRSRLRTLDGWRLHNATPVGTKQVAARQAVKRPKKGTGDLERFLRAEYAEVFGVPAPGQADWILLKLALCYELQYRGFKNTDSLEALSPEFLRHRDLALKLDWAVLPKRKADMVRWSHWEAIQTPAKEERKMAKAAKTQTAAQAETFSKRIGKTLGLGVGETWVHLFKTNSTCPKAARKTDEQITAFLRAEFPEKQSAIFNAVQGVRGKYNRGGFGEVPKVHSVPYDQSGNPIEVKRGAKPKAAAPVVQQKTTKATKAAPAKAGKVVIKKSKQAAAPVAQAQA